MLRITRAEWNLAQRLPPEGITAGQLHIGLQTWTHPRAGVVIEVSFGEGSPVSHVWLDDAGWHAWCDRMLGTADVKTVDAVLLEEIAEWALSPLLAESKARVMRQNASPRSFMQLPAQCGIVFTWQTEQVAFQAVLLGHTDDWFEPLCALIPRDAAPTSGLPPLQCALYAGECELPLSTLRQLMPGEGIVMRPFGDLRAGHFVLLPLLERVAYVQINGDNTMQINSLETERDCGSIDIQDACASAESVSIDLDALPQKLMVEVGVVTVTCGLLRTLQVGDTLAVDAEFTPDVTLKLNGRAIGKGALMGCGDRFLVQIRQWYLAAQR